ncbi:cytidylyltransferase family-domain-containing protein [Phaeosphaeriaceae sp. PMI808]|nr:cytidylyltransferase family-domain-containing protein [Phaeosphaeriaceae sp. PMI808]
MESSRQYQIPHTPRVISPTPPPSETGSAKDGYFGPVTRSSTRKHRQQDRVQSPPAIDEDSSGSDPEKRARARSRSPMLEGGVPGRRRRMSGLTSRRQVNGLKKSLELTPNGTSNAHLSPAQANRNYWREMSRSPSPLGLIPIHQKWRSFIHKHEIPRKILHVSIGFLVLLLYTSGTQPPQIHPILLTTLLPITLTDLLRHKYWQLNRIYIRCLGALMRESEVDGYNGVISYLLGAWIVMRFCPKDIAVMSILLLSWCDTAASTFGRLWGRYTPAVRRGKSLAGSVAAMVTGVGTAVLWWAYLGPAYAQYNTGEQAFAFQGTLVLPEVARNGLGLDVAQASVTGWWALGIMSVAAGFIASASEAIDFFGWDDNLSIPVLCGVGLWSFVTIFS